VPHEIVKKRWTGALLSVKINTACYLKTTMKDLHNFELARLKLRRTTKKTFWPFWWFSGLVLSRHTFCVPLGTLLVMKTLEDEYYLVIKAYKFRFLYYHIHA